MNDSTPPPWTDDDILTGMSKVKPKPTPARELPLSEFSEYIGSFVAADYLIERLLITGRVYSLTAATGHLKTAWATYAALSVACGRPMAGLEVKKCRVLYLSGENDEDQKARTIATAQEFRLTPEPGQFHVLSGSQGIGSLTQRIKDINEAQGPFGLIVTDTSIAYFGGEDENTNTEMQAHAEFFREFTRMPGGPTVLILCHPTKNPTKDNLIPRGGGAFLNAVDGNLTLWKTAERAILHWQGKFRGASFEPMDFQMRLVTLIGYKDIKGQPIESVVIAPLDDAGLARMLREEWTDENKVLDEMLRFPNDSISDWAKAIGWIGSTGQPQKSKVHAILQDLAADKLVEQERKKWVLTNQGRKTAEANAITGKA